MEMKMVECKKHLAVVWFVGGGVLFFILFLQSIRGVYGDKVADAWGWLMPSIMPTLSLMIAVFVMDALNKSRQVQDVIADVFLFRLTFYLSIAYLVVALLTILLQPFSTSSPSEIMQLSHLWMGPFQGLVTASLGAFFMKNK